MKMVQCFQMFINGTVDVRMGLISVGWTPSDIVFPNAGDHGEFILFYQVSLRLSRRVSIFFWISRLCVKPDIAGESENKNWCASESVVVREL